MSHLESVSTSDQWREAYNATLPKVTEFYSKVPLNSGLWNRIKAYSETDFRRLMQYGEGVGGRNDLGLMTYVAKSRFAYFTEQELTDLYAYLKHLSEQQ